LKQIRGLGLGIGMVASIFQKLARFLGDPLKNFDLPPPGPVSQGWVRDNGGGIGVEWPIEIKPRAYYVIAKDAICATYRPFLQLSH